MSSAVAELETTLQGMLALKPPGVSGSRITSITALCVANVQVGNMASDHENVH
jgi:protein NRD1